MKRVQHTILGSVDSLPPLSVEDFLKLISDPTEMTRETEENEALKAVLRGFIPPGPQGDRWVCCRILVSLWVL